MPVFAGEKTMKVPNLPLSIVALMVSLAAFGFGQSNGALTRNNPYSPSPAGKIAAASPTSSPRYQPSHPPTSIAPQQIAFVTKDSRNATLEGQSPVVRTDTDSNRDLARPVTHIYRIGVGDVVSINLKNSPQGSGFYTVRENGEIDYPLAGPHVLIGDKTADEAAVMLRSAIKLFPDPRVEVKVQYYRSRMFSVDGLANNPGEKVLRREAMPMFAIRAESEVPREATTVRITRATNSAVESYALSDATTDNVLVFAGDRVVFAQETKPEVAQYTIAGLKRSLATGTRLSHAVAEVLGQKAEPKQAVLLRTDDKGSVIISEYDMGSIKKGKVLDPALRSGDVIEIKN